uniref:Uncharacterized protein n=1 Tax=Anguilla anguilla TaxID=7936 RepID=A0A0E9RG55_ANGAN
MYQHNNRYGPHIAINRYCTFINGVELWSGLLQNFWCCGVLQYLECFRLGETGELQ